MMTWRGSNLASVLVTTTERKEFVWPNRVYENLAQTTADVLLVSTVHTAAPPAYNAKMVREILKVKTLLPEASFDNDADLLDWLNQP